MCDSIANGGPRVAAAQCCPPANVVIASNVLDTNGNVIAGNVISVDGTFTGNLYVAGNIVSNISYSILNVAGPINGASIWGASFFGDGNGLSNINASNITGTISNTNLPPSGVTAGTYGSSANVSQVTVDQYGLVTVATNVAITASQWTTVAGNVAYQNGVSIGTLSAPPVGSNLYVLGSANITDVLNVSTLYVNSATVFGSATLNVFGISNLNSVLASLYIGNGSGLSNLNSSNLVGNVAAANVSSSVTNPAQPNITSVGTLTGLSVQGLLIASNGSAISNLNSSNLVGNVAAANVASSVTNPSQPNITSVGTLTGLTVNGLLVASNGSAISNLNSANLVGNVAAANVASSVTNPSQPNITSVGTLTSLAVSGILQANLLSGNGSGISNINGANVVSTVGTAQSVTTAAQPNITSVGTLTSLTVIGSISGGTISGDGQGLYGIHANSIVDTVMTANSVVQAAQPNITSVGTLTGLNVQGLLIASNGSAISNINGGNVSTVRTAQSITVASQPNITSVGTLTSLNVSGISNLNSIVTNLISGNASGLSNITASNLIGTISTGILPTSGVTAGLYGSGANVSSVTVDQYGRITNATNVAITASQWTSNTGNSIYYANYVGIGATFVPSATLHVIGNAYVSNSVTTTNIFFTNTIQDTNLPTTAVTPGAYGSGANVPQIVVDQYGRLTSASNVSFTATSQWTSVDSNVAFGNGVSIGSLTNPPAGSNLYVLGVANIGSINTSSLSISNINLSSSNIGTLVVPTQLNVVSANILTDNVSTSNIVTANIGTLNVSGSANLVNLRVGTLANLISANVTTANVTTDNVITANIVTLNVSTAANITNLTVRTLANLVSANITNANVATDNVVMANIVTLNVSTAANITNLTVRTQANMASANITTDNVLTTNIVTANVGSLTVPGSLVSNATNLTFLYDTILIPYLNVSTTGNVSNLSVTTGNVVTLNASSIFITNSNLVTANITTENVVTLNGSSIFATNSNVTTLNASSIRATNSNLAAANVTTENVLTLNATTLTTFYDVFAGPVRVGRGANLVSTDTVLGANVLLNDPGSYDTAIGYQSMKNAAPFVGYDTALGSDTLQSDAGPGYNVAIGSAAMVSSSPAQGQDVAIGFSALQSDSGAGYNTAIGTYSMQNSTPGGGNDVAVGYYALAADNGPGYNTAIGGQAMQGANPGSGFDVAVGWQSLQNDTGSYNTAIGANAGQGITGGTHNTALGAGAGPFSSLLNNTTAIGSNAQPTVSDVAVFPYGINVGINTGAPGASLEVQGNVFVSNSITTPNLTVTANIISPIISGNTYLDGNIIVSGNVFSSLGTPLGAGGGYYFSLSGDIALQVPYTGALYGTTYPLSVGLSNGFTINGTSTLITVTPNGNFQFSVAGPYMLRAVFNSTDNIKGLAVGSNVADIHGTDQGYMYRYTTFITQNPTELIEIPFNVTDTTKYYYLDLFSTDGGSLFQTANTAGGTYLTITPLTGGGLATGGPGGTPGTQWINSGSNIYFSNSVGIGALNPQYNLDVSGGTTASKFMLVSNISSLGGPILNITSNVQISANLAVGGVVATTPPYALYVTGQGYFSGHVSYENFSGYRNRLINGTFRIASRANTLTVSNTSIFSLSNAFVMDRWFVDVGNLSTSNVSMTISQDVSVGQTNGFSNVANVYVTRAFGATLDNTWICPLVQTVEASGVYDLRFGQSTAKPMVLSFYANAAVTGNYSVILRSKADNTYFANLVTLTNSWNRYTVDVPACTIGTWGAGTAGSIQVCLCGVSFGSGRANVAPTTNWTANPGYAPVACTGAVNWMASAPSQLQITGVQLELGTIATPFEIRLLSETVRFCQRYYERNPDIQYSSALGSGRINSTPYVVTKRERANVTVFRDLSNLTANTNVSQFVAYYGDGALKGTQAINSYLSSDYGFSFNFTNTGSKFMDASIMEAQFVWQADSEIY